MSTGIFLTASANEKHITCTLIFKSGTQVRGAYVSKISSSHPLSCPYFPHLVGSRFMFALFFNVFVLARGLNYKKASAETSADIRRSGLTPTIPEYETPTITL
ncbi:MAG TPA: hypothetical protein PKE66_05785, partial [Pyrinomonadaceae bacterium]|nr:hypothetical protein [Pyrinomonadaceae bacterium]